MQRFLIGHGLIEFSQTLSLRTHSTSFLKDSNLVTPPITIASLGIILSRK